MYKKETQLSKAFDERCSCFRGMTALTGAIFSHLSPLPVCVAVKCLIFSHSLVEAFQEAGLELGELKIYIFFGH